jgi:hypothetical protein
VLDNNLKSWPQVGNLVLDGFVYEGINGLPLDPHQRESWLAARLDWLRRHRDNEFSLQPYEHLSSILRRGDHEVDAKRVLYKKQQVLRQRDRLGIFGWCWGELLRWSIGYGYYPYRTFIGALVFILVGWWIFNYGFQHGMLLPTDDKELPFNALVYSLDTFLPIIDFHQEAAWMPKDDSLFGSGVRVYFWIHIAAGWILTTLGVIGFTGLVRNE